MTRYPSGLLGEAVCFEVVRSGQRDLAVEGTQRAEVLGDPIAGGDRSAASLFAKVAVAAADTVSCADDSVSGLDLARSRKEGRAAVGVDLELGRETGARGAGLIEHKRARTRADVRLSLGGFERIGEHGARGGGGPSR